MYVCTVLLSQGVVKQLTVQLDICLCVYAYVLLVMQPFVYCVTYCLVSHVTVCYGSPLHTYIISRSLYVSQSVEAQVRCFEPYRQLIMHHHFFYVLFFFVFFFY